MDTLGSILNPILEYLQTGFDKVNAVQGLLIALFATVLMRAWGQLFLIAAGASLVYIVIDTLTPIVTRNGDIKLPPVVTMPFWQNTLSLFVGFIIVIAMFFAVKTVVFMRGGGKKAKAH